MEQHYRLFTSYRQPGREADVQLTDLEALGSEYIVVACNNQVSVCLNLCNACHHLQGLMAR